MLPHYRHWVRNGHKRHLWRGRKLDIHIARSFFLRPRKMWEFCPTCKAGHVWLSEGLGLKVLILSPVVWLNPIPLPISRIEFSGLLFPSASVRKNKYKFNGAMAFV